VIQIEPGKLQQATQTVFFLGADLHTGAFSKALFTRIILGILYFLVNYYEGAMADSWYDISANRALFCVKRFSDMDRPVFQRRIRGMSELWDAWMGNLSAAEALQQIDRAILTGKFRNRREAFVDFARTAIRSRAPDVPDKLTPEALGSRLQAYAEGSELVGP
jgi:hypothetical protein